MLTATSPTQIAFLLVALIQAVFAVIWGMGAYALTIGRAAVLYWVAWSGLSAVTWTLLALHVEDPPLIAVLAGAIAIIALQRGIRQFIGREPPQRWHAVALGLAVVAYWLGDLPADRPLQAVINYGVITALYLSIGWDLYQHARDQLRFRWPVLLSLPVLLGSVAYGSRAVRALVDPGSVLDVMASDSAMNVRAAMIFVVLVLSLHAMLMVLVFSRLVAELRRLSRHDALTGLLNRRVMEELLQSQIERSRRTGETFVLMMLDLDHFKRINDHHGHAVGDLALKHVATLLTDSMPKTAALARFGGEEFVVLFPGSQLLQAEQLAERMRETLLTAPLLHLGASLPLSVSIGVAQWRGAADELSQLFLRADAALFQAKVQGRNRVVVSMDSRVAALQ